MSRIKNAFNSLFNTEAVEQPSRTSQKRQQSQINSELFKEMFPTGLYERMFSVTQDIDMDLLQDTFAGAQAGQIGDLFELYINIENSDARLSGMINSRRSAVVKQDYTIDAPADLPNRDEIMQHVRDNVRSLKWNLILKNLMDGRLHGAAVFEKIWHKRADGRLWLKEIKPADMQSIRMDVDSSTGMGAMDKNKFGKIYLDNIVSVFNNRISSNPSNSRLYVEDIDPRKVVTALNTNRKGYYDLSGVMRPVARWYVLKTFAVHSWAQYAETYGFPIPIVKVQENYFKKNKGLIKNLLQSVGVNRYGIFFPDMDYELHNQADTASVSVFEKLIQTSNTEMAIGILGQNLTSEVKGGSQAAAKTHYDVLDNLIEDDLEWLDEVINDQIIPDIVSLNFPNVDPQLYPSYKSIMKKSVDLQKLGSGLKVMSSLVEIPKAWVYDQAQIPAPQEDEETIGGMEDDILTRIDRRNSQS